MRRATIYAGAEAIREQMDDLKKHTLDGVREQIGDLKKHMESQLSMAFCVSMRRTEDAISDLQRGQKRIDQQLEAMQKRLKQLICQNQQI
jgi:regulator of replication initiation timing